MMQMQDIDDSSLAGLSIRALTRPLRRQRDVDNSDTASVGSHMSVIMESVGTSVSDVVQVLRLRYGTFIKEITAVIIFGLISINVTLFASPIMNGGLDNATIYRKGMDNSSSRKQQQSSSSMRRNRNHHLKPLISMPQDLSSALDVILEERAKQNIFQSKTNNKNIRTRREQQYYKASFLKIGSTENRILQDKLHQNPQFWMGMEVEYDPNFWLRDIAVDEKVKDHYKDWKQINAVFSSSEQCNRLENRMVTICKRYSHLGGGAVIVASDSTEETAMTHKEQCVGNHLIWTPCMTSISYLVYDRGNRDMRNQMLDCERVENKGPADLEITIDSQSSRCFTHVDILQINSNIPENASRIIHFIQSGELKPLCIHFRSHSKSKSSTSSDWDQQTIVTLIAKGYEWTRLEGEGYTLACLTRGVSPPLTPFAFAPSSLEEALDLILDERGVQDARGTVVHIIGHEQKSINPVIKGLQNYPENWAVLKANLQVDEIPSHSHSTTNYDVSVDPHHCINGFVVSCNFDDNGNSFFRRHHHQDLKMDLETCQKYMDDITQQWSSQNINNRQKQSCVTSLHELVQNYGGLEMGRATTVCDEISGACTTHVDLLVIDLDIESANGNGYGVVKQVMFDAFVPHCIYYRSNARERHQSHGMANFLMSRGYSVAQEGKDYAIACIAHRF